MRKLSRKSLSLMVLLVLGGCATMPSGPSVRVLPAPGKPFEQFMSEDSICRQWAAAQLGESPEHGARRSAATGATVGTLIGAGAGAAIGAAAGSPGAGAAIGGGSGLLFGTAAGAGSGDVYGSEAQRRYDNTYVQCMYAKGNQVPGVASPRRMRYTSPPDSVPPDYRPPR
jgi:hypothetical protein